MRPYEMMVVLRPDLEEEALQGWLDRLSGVIRDREGEVENVDRWGKRRLAYEIDGQREGIYAVYTFSAPEGATRELERVLRISEEVLRHLIVSRDT